MYATYSHVFWVTILQPFPEVHKYNTLNLLTVYLTMLAEVYTLNCKGYRRYPSRPSLRYCSDVRCKTTKKKKKLQAPAVYTGNCS